MVDLHQVVQRPERTGLGVALTFDDFVVAEEARGLAVEASEDPSGVGGGRCRLGRDLSGFGDSVEVAIGHAIEGQEGAAKCGLLTQGGLWDVALELGEELEGGAVRGVGAQSIACRGFGGNDVLAVNFMPLCDMSMEVTCDRCGESTHILERLVHCMGECVPGREGLRLVRDSVESIEVHQLAGPANTHESSRGCAPAACARARANDRAPCL